MNTRVSVAFYGDNANIQNIHENWKTDLEFLELTQAKYPPTHSFLFYDSDKFESPDMNLKYLVDSLAALNESSDAVKHVNTHISLIFDNEGALNIPPSMIEMLSALKISLIMRNGSNE